MALVCLALGCAGDPASPSTGGETSTLSFTYAGDVSGVYSAEGRPYRASEEVLAPTDYAVALSYPAGSSRSGTLSVIANDLAGRANGDMLLMGGIPPRRGTVSLSPSVGGLLHRGLLWSPTQFRSELAYVLDSGELTVTAYGQSRVRGTFRGIAYAYRGGFDDRQRFIAITNGRFDLALDDSAATPFRCRLFDC